MRPPLSFLPQPAALLPTPPAPPPPPSSSPSCRGSSTYAAGISAPRPPRPRAPVIVLRGASGSCPGPSMPAAGRLLHLEPTPQASADGRCRLLHCGPLLPDLPSRSRPPAAARRRNMGGGRGEMEEPMKLRGATFCEPPNRSRERKFRGFTAGAGCVHSVPFGRAPARAVLEPLVGPCQALSSGLASNPFSQVSFCHVGNSSVGLSIHSFHRQMGTKFLSSMR
jgi:hypothetical protein